MLKDLNKQSLINFLKSPKIKENFKNHNLEHLYLIWSFARDEANKDSDIDLMYKKRQWWLWAFKFIDFKQDLEKRIWRKVDLVNEKFLYKDLKPYVEKDKILIF